jgi:hypothetical protein
MKKYIVKHFHLLFIIFCVCITPIQAQSTKENHSDSIRLSLLTCAPGQEIYSLFGHTAIRYENFTQHIDAVFNYGIFSFNTPNFILRFTLGETDYQLGVSSYEQFAAEYNYYGRSVWQQTLNLNIEEKKRLIELLETNYRPENRVYRYNFFYDNCATRPRDQIEKAIIGKLIYPEDMKDDQTGKSFRDIIHQYTKGHPWDRFGIDLCIGSKADKPINRRLMMFAPFYVKDFFSKTIILDRHNNKRPLIEIEEKIITQDNTTSDSSLSITPLQASLLLFISITALTIYGIRYKKNFWGADIILFSIAGIAGCILTFLAIFSSHPAVSPNYLLFIFHPLHLFLLPWVIKQVKKKRRSIYLMLNCGVLTLFILLWWFIPQKIDLAVLPLALCLLVRSTSNLILTYKKD